MPVEVGQGCHFVSQPPAKEQRNTLQSYAAKRAGRNKSNERPIPQADPVQHNYLHDLESLFWLVVWAITYRLGYHEAVSEIFAPYVDSFVTSSRFRHLNEPWLLRNALEAIPGSINNVKESIEDAREFISGRYHDMFTPEMRRDIAQHSSQYIVMRDLVFERIPGDVPLISTDSCSVRTLLHEPAGTQRAASVRTSAKRDREYV